MDLRRINELELIIYFDLTLLSLLVNFLKEIKREIFYLVNYLNFSFVDFLNISGFGFDDLLNPSSLSNAFLMLFNMSNYIPRYIN